MKNLQDSCQVVTSRPSMRLRMEVRKAMKNTQRYGGGEGERGGGDTDNFLLITS